MSNLIDIEDFSCPELDVYIRMTGPQQRNKLNPDQGLFVAEGLTVISVALDAGYEPVSVLTERRMLERAEKELFPRLGETPVYCASREQLASLTGYELTRGILCAMRRKPLPSPVYVLEKAHRVAVLEDICDSTNIGAIFRSAAGLGIDAILLSPTSCDPLCRRSLRVSMGTALLIPWTYYPGNAEDWETNGVRFLQSLDFSCAAMALSDDSVSVEDETLCREERLAVFLGSEGKGLLPSTIRACDYTVKIPMSYGVDSLNVAAASAVAFWQLRYR